MLELRQETKNKMKKSHQITIINKVASFTLGQSIYLKRKKATLSFDYLIERFLLQKIYGKNRQYF